MHYLRWLAAALFWLFGLLAFVSALRGARATCPHVTHRLWMDCRLAPAYGARLTGQG